MDYQMFKEQLAALLKRKGKVSMCSDWAVVQNRGGFNVIDRTYLSVTMPQQIACNYSFESYWF